MTGRGDDSQTSRGGLLSRPWLVVGLALAVAATGVLVLSDDLRWLRLGIVAALWAALIGAFLAGNYRRQAVANSEAVAEAQAVYEAELEREIVARREFELEIEVETRQRVEADAREELAALREEVSALRENLQSLFGGEVFYERVALTAQSTRMRSFGEDQRLVTAGEGHGSGGRGQPQLPAGRLQQEAPGVQPNDGPVEAFGQARRDQPQRTNGHPSPPARGNGEADPPTRRVRPADIASARASAGTDESRTEAVRRQQRAEATRNGQAPVRPEPVQPHPQQNGQQPHPQQQNAQPQNAQPQNGRRQNAQAPRQAEQGREPAELTRPAMEATARGRPASSVAPPSRPAEPVGPSRTRRPADVARHVERQPVQPPTERPEPVEDRPDGLDRVLPPSSASDEVAPRLNGHHKQEAAEPQPVPATPRSARTPEAGRPGGRRRRADDEELPSDEAALEGPESGGGRRRRADGDPPWQGLTAPAANGSRHASAGTHAKPDAGAGERHGQPNGQSNAQPNGHRNGGQNGSRRALPEEAAAELNGTRAAGGRRTAEEPVDAGSHSSGLSVSELLAAHGGSSGPRRRRRAED